MKIKSIFIFVIYIVLSGFHIPENPQTKISNSILKAMIYLPDAENGYYRATRFDWSGVISSLEYRDHKYFGKWLDNYSPTSHNSIMGPVDSFEPLNYDNTKPGGAFVKIGVGSLMKTDNQPFNAFTTYPFIDLGTWEITSEEAKIKFQHILDHKDYSYVYTKTIELVKGKAEMVITYKLKNTGKLAIATEVFNHNLLIFDNQVVGKGFELSFQKSISCADISRGIGDIVEIHDKKLKIIRSLDKGESAYCGSLEGINNNLNGYNIKIDCFKTGTGVRITGNKPLSKLVFWCNTKTICPEPYININVDPGKEFSWETTYEFL